MEEPQSLGLLDVRLAFQGGQGLPPLAQSLGDLGVVHVRVALHDLATFQLRPHHEGVHGTLDVVQGMLLGLW